MRIAVAGDLVGTLRCGVRERRQHAVPITMAYLNEHYLKLQAGYLFPEVARRVREFCEAHPEAAKRLIRCGIGDVTEPLPRAAIEAMKLAAEELGHRETFRGYGPEQGYEFLRSTIGQRDYRDRGIEIADDEIFVSDGSKCDCGYILDILGGQNKVAVPDPVYPVYVDTNVMAGHTGPVRKNGSYEGINYLPCTDKNNFVPEPPNEHVDLVYLCFPNNPTGAVASRAQLSRWVEYALQHGALLLFDAAYEAYISRSRNSAFDFRDSWRATMRYRIAQLFEERRFHRRALRVYGDCQNPCLREPAMAAGSRCIHFGSGVGAPNRTAWLTQCSAPPKRCIPQRAVNKSAR